MLFRSLAPHERLPEVLVLPREKTPTGGWGRPGGGEEGDKDVRGSGPAGDSSCCLSCFVRQICRTREAVDSHPPRMQAETGASPKSPARPRGGASPGAQVGMGRGFPWGAGGFYKHKLVPFSFQQLHVNLVIILASRWSLLDPDQS